MINLSLQASTRLAFQSCVNNVPLCIPVRLGRFLAPGSYPLPFHDRFDEDGNRRPLPHPESHFLCDELPPASSAKIADKKPFRVICEPKKIYWWCACGLSKEQPFCDGHHAKHSYKWPAKHAKQMFKPIRIVFEKKTEVWFCQCKKTSSPPYCDGSHKCDAVQTAFRF